MVVLIRPYPVARNSARVDNAVLRSRIDQVYQLVSDTCQSREELAQLLRDQAHAGAKQTKKLDDMSQQLVAQEKNSQGILGTARDTLSGIFEVKALLIQISESVGNLQLAASNSMFFRPLDPVKDFPAVLEDALGNELPIPSEWLSSIEWTASRHSKSPIPIKVLC